MLTWFVAFLVATVVILLMVIAVVLLPRVLRTTTGTARFHCPWVGRNVVVRFLGDEQRRPVAVMSCTAFADPNVVTCERGCLGAHLLTGEPRTPSTVPAD